MNVLEVLSGTTLRVGVIFHNFDGALQDPSIVKFKVYDRTFKLISDSPLGPANKVATGKYFYDYVMPNEPYTTLYLEFYGEIAGNPTVERKRVVTTFVKD